MVFVGTVENNFRVRAPGSTVASVQPNGLDRLMQRGWDTGRFLAFVSNVAKSFGQRAVTDNPTARTNVIWIAAGHGGLG